MRPGVHPPARYRPANHGPTPGRLRGPTGYQRHHRPGCRSACRGPRRGGTHHPPRREGASPAHPCRRGCPRPVPPGCRGSRATLSPERSGPGAWSRHRRSGGGGSAMSPRILRHPGPTPPVPDPRTPSPARPVAAASCVRSARPWRSSPGLAPDSCRLTRGPGPGLPGPAWPWRREARGRPPSASGPVEWPSARRPAGWAGCPV